MGAVGAGPTRTGEIQEAREPIGTSDPTSRIPAHAASSAGTSTGTDGGARAGLTACLTGLTAEYEEVASGLWVPRQVREEHYALAEGQVQAWLSTRLWVLESFERNPRLSPSVFRLEAPVFEEDRAGSAPEPGVREAIPPPSILKPGLLPELFTVAP